MTKVHKSKFLFRLCQVYIRYIIWHRFIFILNIAVCVVELDCESSFWISLVISEIVIVVLNDFLWIFFFLILRFVVFPIFFNLREKSYESFNKCFKPKNIKILFNITSAFFWYAYRSDLTILTFFLKKKTKTILDFQLKRGCFSLKRLI